MSTSANVLDKVKGWRPYVEARLGFRNHWYPTLLSSEVAEGNPVTFELCGEKLLINRVDGKVFCVRDRCLHRGVNFSARLECYAKGTLTCWYHGFTYRWDSGELVGILTNPDSVQIGKHRLRTFPVEEQKGIIFVFMGDMAPPPLAHDVPPDFLDADMAIFGKRRVVNSNWRVGVENGFDSGHIWIHKNSILVTGNDLALPVGFAPLEGVATTRLVEDEDGPKGVYDLLGNAAMPVFESYLFGEKVAEGHFGSTRVADTISIWLPCVLKVDPWRRLSPVRRSWWSGFVFGPTPSYGVGARSRHSGDAPDRLRRWRLRPWADDFTTTAVRAAFERAGSRPWWRRKSSTRPPRSPSNGSPSRAISTAPPSALSAIRRGRWRWETGSAPPRSCASSWSCTR